MAQAIVQRKYNLTDYELCQFTSNLCNTLTRDLVMMEKFGLDSSKVASLKALGDAYEIFPSDDMLEGDLMIATDEKNAKLEEVRETIRDMALRVEATWGSGSGQYRRLGVAGMNNVSDEAIIYLARRVHTVVSGYLSALAESGLTQIMLDDFQDLNEAYEIAKNSQQDAIQNRDIGTIERIRKGNEIYDLVSTYCDFGKRAWYSVDPAKYNDYVIYTGGATGLPGKIQNVAYDNITTRISWDADAVAVTYQVEISTDENNWEVMYEDTDAYCQIGQDPGTYFARVRGINAQGNGAWSDNFEYTVIVQAPVMIEILYQPANNRVVVDWQGVAYADKYEVWNSEVATGQPAGTFTKLSEPTNHLYYHTTYTVGNRNYYYVKAVSVTFGMTSEPSGTMFVEIPV